jgi:hypothetical protein
MAVPRPILTAFSLLAILFSPVALAQSTVPDIVGQWDAVEGSHAIFTGEMGNEMAGTIEIDVAAQLGYAFNGTLSWSRFDPEDPPTHDGTEQTPEAVEDIMGVFTGDGASFIIVEHPDTGMMFGRILDDDRLEIIIAESGEYALASRHVFVRRQ